ncbi:MAG TPA: substrate-binding domain-containing protein [Armatimonadota bacterium]|jgi:DNA-binding LacI/PurR family transcriptional regulator
MRTKCELLREQFLTELMKNRWPAGARLPGLPELARQFDATPGTMERVLRLLITQGVLDRKPKQGTFVRKRSSNELFTQAPIVVVGWGPEAFDDVYTSTVLKVIHHGLPDHNWVFLHSFQSAEIAFALHALHANTLIALAPSIEDVRQIEPFLASDMQILCVGSRAESSGIHTITTDNAFGVAEGMRYLARLGHQRVAFISRNIERTDHIERYRTFRRSRSRYGFSTDPRLLQWKQSVSNNTPDYVADALDRWYGMEAPPTAIFAGGGPLVFSLLEALQARNIRIPQDVSLITYDDYPMAAYYNPPMTVIRQPLEEMGKVAIKALHKLAAPVHRVIHAVIKPALVIRGSCAPPGAGGTDDR